MIATRSLETANRILDAAPAILRRWERRVRAGIPASAGQPRSVLRNNLGRVLRQIAAALAPDLPIPDELPDVREPLGGLTLSEDHGGHRAQTAPYRLADVFREYRYLRTTILQVLTEGGAIAPEDAEVITNALEQAMEEAGSQYALVREVAGQEREEAAQRLVAELENAYRRERRITEFLQRPLRLPIAEDAFDGLAVATQFAPALAEAEVGGDFYDVFPLRDGRVAFVVGDACGKGLAAAVHNTHVKDVLRAFLRDDAGHPGAVLGRVNDLFCDTLAVLEPPESDSFIVLALLIVDAATGAGVLVSAGAEPLLVVRAGGSVEEVMASGMVLGVQTGEVYPECALRLSCGDTALLFTDGLTEARHHGVLLEFDGVARLAQAALELRSLKAAGEAIVDAVREFGQGALSDDLCLVMVRRR